MENGFQVSTTTPNSEPPSYWDTYQVKLFPAPHSRDTTQTKPVSVPSSQAKPVSVPSPQVKSQLSSTVPSSTYTNAAVDVKQSSAVKAVEDTKPVTSTAGVNTSGAKKTYRHYFRLVDPDTRKEIPFSFETPDLVKELELNQVRYH